MGKAIGRGPVRWIGAAIAFIGAAAVLAVVLNVTNVAQGVDRRAVERETAALKQGLHLLGELTASEQLSLTQWDEALEKVVVRRSNRFIRDYFGRSVFSEPDEQRIYILDGDGTVSFASHRNAAPQPEEARHVVEVTEKIVSRVTVRYGKALKRGLALDGRFGDRMLEGVYEHGLATVNGAPALIVASPFIGDVHGQDVPDQPTMMLEVRPLTPALMARLGQLAHLDGVDVVEVGETVDGPSHVITDTRGTEVVRITWSHSAPGSTVLLSALPALTLSMFVIALLSLGAAIMLQRKTVALAASERSALHASRHDAATGLANRGWFMNEFSRIASERSIEGVSGVVLIDCDYFKAINDTLGHSAGDAVLLAISERLKGLGDRLQLAARLGGDEFAVVTAPVVDSDEFDWQVSSIADTLMRPVRFGQQAIPVSVSIGAFVIAPREGTAEMLSRADLALYRAKRDGRGCFRIYDAVVDVVSAAPVDPAVLAQDRRHEGGRAAA